MLVFNSSRQLLTGTRRSTNDDPVHGVSYITTSVETECHPPPLSSAKRYPQTDDVRIKTDHELAHATEEKLATVHSALPANAETYLQTDKEPTETQTNADRRSTMGGANSQTVQGPSRVPEKPPAMVNIEEIGTNDIVIAYVIKSRQ